MNYITILPAATSPAATTPAANTTHGVEQRRRGLGDKHDMGHHLARVNSPARKYDGCYLASRSAGMLILFVACMAVGAVSISAQITGFTDTLRAMWHQTP